jgi:hypothetical protein
MLVTVQDDGTLVGDPVTVEALRLAAELYDGRAIGPTNGPQTLQDHLSSPISAWYLLPRLFEEGATISGEPPAIPARPPGQDELNLEGWTPPADEAEPSS